MLLAVLGTGVFLAGLELMITAVALPAIVTDLATWTRLREASWIINGYLLVYVVTMPLAGRLADLWGNRRVFLGALGLFTVGSALAAVALAFGLGARASVANLIAAHYVARMVTVGQDLMIDDIRGTVIELTPTAVVLKTELGRVVVPAQRFHDTDSVTFIESS